MAKIKNNGKDGIEKLEDIGLREVSRKTYIELNYLKLMVNKEFSSLQRVKTLGFVKIIQREYDINMDDWVKEFEEYFQQDNHEKPKEQNSDTILEPRKNTKRSKSIYTVFAVLFLILFMIFAYSFTRGRTGHIESIPIISNITIENDTVEDALDDIDVRQLDDITINEDSIINMTDEDSTNETDDINQQTIKNLKAKISPNTTVWIGVIELATSKKHSYLQEHDMDIDLNKEQLIITGHGDFTLKAENISDRTFDPRKKTFFYVSDGKINEVKENEFLLLNGGKSW
ncbi:MAG: hypothetical protein LBG21_07165 [Campylobacteraceae bacterium]|jgi:cytoskeletal protein RodZ|nr:hypothetical protein [Campylobacteraceae bacterium]